MRPVYVAVFCWLGLLAGCHEFAGRRPAPAGLGAATSAIESNDASSWVRQVDYAAAPEVLFAELPSVDEPNTGNDWRLSLAELEQIALTANPTLAELAAMVDAAHGQWIQAGLRPNTVLGYSGQQLGSHGQSEQQGIYISQEWVRGGKQQLDQAMACEQIRAAEQRLAAQQQRVLTDVRLGYYEVLVAQQRIGVAEQLLASAGEALRTAETLYQAMEINQLEVIGARIEQQRAELFAKEARHTHHAAWSRLNSVLGSGRIPSTQLEGDLRNWSGSIDPDTALGNIMAASPEVAAALSEVERARWAVDRAHAEAVPDAELQLVLQSDNGTGSSNGNLQVAMPIPWFDRNQGGIQRAHAELRAAEQAVETIEFRLQQKLAAVLQRFASARDRVQDYSKPAGILDQAGASLEFVQRAYDASELGYSELVAAQKTHAELSLAYLEALGQMWYATVEVEGLLLKDSFDRE